MKSDSNTLLEDVLALPVNQRIEVVEKLLQSLDMPSKQTEEIWAEEADSRVESYEDGRLGSLAAEEVLQKYK
ncbi:addiction module protein [Agaribacter flavus]|uniref:Addiction module protein n=1 Tax=Agaribacter flavus TaxID=1902781 RepID=A0ABV7FIT9_9ALTE